jgi:H+-translocating NAD(P) transhydrogenase subunit alpha
MQIGVPKEVLAGETRVAASPNSVTQLLKLGFDVVIESQAGVKASFDDAAYEVAGAKIVSKEEIWTADVILKVNAPTFDEIELLQDGASLISFI